ncbi:MAG: hypothetical protein IKN54_08380 [Lachnospiraceae bacterium]|nr:hypothetical protein [Lachnospiraceae bacterium]
MNLKDRLYERRIVAVIEILTIICAIILSGIYTKNEYDSAKHKVEEEFRAFLQRGKTNFCYVPSEYEFDGNFMRDFFEMIVEGHDIPYELYFGLYNKYLWSSEDKIPMAVNIGIFDRKGNKVVENKDRIFAALKYETVVDNVVDKDSTIACSLSTFDEEQITIIDNSTPSSTDSYEYKNLREGIEKIKGYYDGDAFIITELTLYKFKPKKKKFIETVLVSEKMKDCSPNDLVVCYDYDCYEKYKKYIQHEDVKDAKMGKLFVPECIIIDKNLGALDDYYDKYEKDILQISEHNYEKQRIWKCLMLITKSPMNG